MRNLIRFSEGVNRKKKGVMFWLVRNRKRQTELCTYSRENIVFGRKGEEPRAKED